MRNRGAPSLNEVAPDVLARSHSQHFRGYAVGIVFALALTVASLRLAGMYESWGPGVVAGLCLLATAQVGVHLLLIFHIVAGTTLSILPLARLSGPARLVPDSRFAIDPGPSQGGVSA